MLCTAYASIFPSVSVYTSGKHLCFFISINHWCTLLIYSYWLNPIQGIRGLETIPAIIGREAGYTLDRSPVHHSATQRQTRHTTMHTHSLETPINLTCMFLDSGRKYPEREATHTQGEHANTTQKGPSWDSNQEPSCCEATVLTTTTLCSPIDGCHNTNSTLWNNKAPGLRLCIKYSRLQ